MRSKRNDNRAAKAPKALKKGDTVALICPSAHIGKERVEKALSTIRKMGFFATTFSKTRKRYGYFAADDSYRAEELDWAFSEPGIRAVLTCRGGYGSARALHLIKPQRLRSWEPKIFVGYSDITYFHQWLYNQLNWMSFHGPLVGYLSDKDLKQLLRQLMALPRLRSKEAWPDLKPLKTTASKARGRLVGGNLSLLQTSGAAELPKEPIVLAIEDIKEDYYRLDRMIWNLISAGYQAYVKAIVLGRLQGCQTKGFSRAHFYDSLHQLSQGPVWTSNKFGHGLHSQKLLALGARVEISGKTLHYREPLAK